MDTNFRKYDYNDIITFAKTDGKFGGLSNMSPGFTLFINEINIQSSEILYQACKFSLFPNIQEEIIKTQNPMDAKKISRKYNQYVRQDWEKIKFKVMRWCLEIKLIQNFNKFSNILLSTNDKIIVEFSKTDNIWGAIPTDNKNVLEGKNALGRLLMELRSKIQSGILDENSIIYPLPISGFNLYDYPIEEIRGIDYFINDLDEIYAY
ncbi:NADAR family protein [Empedobacter tilapiae]